MSNNQLLASDSFASGSLAAGWSAFASQGNSPSVAAGPPKVTEPTATSTESFIYWSGSTWPNDHASEITVQQLTNEANTYITLGVRIQPVAGTFYFSEWTAGTINIKYYDGATVHTLATGSATAAAGDIIALQAAGSCISLYKNGNRLLYASDANLTGGFPGYGQVSNTNVTHTQVSAWRGYNAIQQDGIWQKQGIVLAPTTADLSASGLGVFEPCCIYDTNPQILVGPNVYKMWFCVGSGTSAGIYYAESADLKTWTRHSGAVIADGATPTVVKQGTTYFIYYQLGSAQGTGTTQISTSTDGLTWSASGHTFATSAYPLKPIAVVSGTWYALWGSLGVSDFASVNLATSPDGLTWTAYGSNPVISTPSTYPYSCYAQVGSEYYVWMQKGPSSPQNTAAASAFDPVECIRYSTTDFHTWSAPVISLHHSQMHEALNTPINNTEGVGGTAPIAIFNIVGKANMLYGLSQGDNIGPQVVQVSLAIGPAPIASIVTAPEDGVQQVATDNFSRGAGAIGANWTVVAAYGTFKIVSGNFIEPSALSTDSLMVYTASTFSSSLYSEVTIHALVGTAGTSGPLTPIIANPSTGAFYYVTLINPTGTQAFQGEINYYDGTTIHALAPLVGVTLQVGDVLRLSRINSASSDVLSFFQNGSLISQGVNLSIPTGTLYPGAYMTETVAARTQVSLWAGGNANVIPNYPPNNPTRGARSK